jgi:hypothetical protein
MPTDWVTHEKTSLLSEEQITSARDEDSNAIRAHARQATRQASLAIAVVSFIMHKSGYGTALLILAGMYWYRAYRFGVHYGREMYLQFLVLDKPEQTPPPLTD